jgi:hypothetical protein
MQEADETYLGYAGNDEPIVFLDELVEAALVRGGAGSRGLDHPLSPGIVLDQGASRPRRGRGQPLLRRVIASA